MSQSFRKIPFAKPEISRSDRKAVDKVLRSGWITTAAICQQFEDEFKNELSIPYAFAVNSATAALHLALEAVGIQAGDLVVTSTMTFVATAEAILYCQAQPILADIDEQTLNMSVDSLKRLIDRYGKRIKAVIPVHHSGRSCEMEKILQLCRPLSIKVIEDAAHSFPGTFQNRFQGTWGDVGVFSFYATKTITTGEGGMVVTRDSQVAEKISRLRLHGIDRDVWNRYTSADAPLTYDVVCRGYKYNLTDIAAALGLSQLKRAHRFREKRRIAVEYYQKQLAELPGIQLMPYDPHSSFHLYILRVLNGKRDELYKALREKGICCSIHYRPLHLMSYYKTILIQEEDELSLATKAYDEILSLPLYSALSRKDLKYIIANFKETVYNIFK